MVLNPRASSGQKVPGQVAGTGDYELGEANYSKTSPPYAVAEPARLNKAQAKAGRALAQAPEAEREGGLKCCILQRTHPV